MMLWYKSWRETRPRMLICAIALVWACAVIVLMQKQARSRGDEPLTYISYIWHAVYQGFARDMFLVLVIVLGLGGLRQEHAQGTSGFTLGLPAARRRLVMVRAGVGLLELAILALLPAVVVPAMSPVVGESYPLLQALQFSALWVCCGAVVFGMAFLLSTAMAGEYSAAIVSIAVLFVYSGVIRLSVFGKFFFLDLFKVMNGMGTPYFQSGSFVLTGPLPWVALCGMMLIAFGLVLGAGRLSQQQDF